MDGMISDGLLASAMITDMPSNDSVRKSDRTMISQDVSRIPPIGTEMGNLGTDDIEMVDQEISTVQSAVCQEPFNTSVRSSGIEIPTSFSPSSIHHAPSPTDAISLLSAAAAIQPPGKVDVVSRRETAHHFSSSTSLNESKTASETPGSPRQPLVGPKHGRITCCGIPGQRDSHPALYKETIAIDQNNHRRCNVCRLTMKRQEAKSNPDSVPTPQFDSSSAAAASAPAPAPRPIPATRGSMLPAYITPQIGINSDEAFNTNNNYIQWSSIITDMNNPLLQISDPIECYQQAGAALILPTVRSQRIVHLANQIKLPEMDGENVKGSHQVLLDNNDSEWWKKVGPEFFTACNELLDALNLRKGRNFKFRETYLMANEPNRGEQCPHTDTADGPWCGHDGELVLFMYLDDGPSTEICIAPQRVFGDVAINVTEAKAIEMLQSLSDHCMRGVEVRAGSMMAMGMHLFHRGPLNRTGRLRRVLYTVYTANATGTRVQHAYYRWQMYGRLLGFSHPLTGAQLLIDSKFITWARLPPDSERDRTLTRMQSHYQKHIEDLEKLKTQQMSNEPPPHPRSPDIPAPSTPHPYNTRSRSPTPEPPPALIPPPSDETCRSLGLGIPGKPREPQQNAILLRHMYDIQSTTSDSYDKVVKKVAKIHLASPHNIRAIDNHYQQAQQLEREDGRNKPPHNYNKSIISLDMDIKMHRYLMEALQKNGCVTAKQLSALFEPTPPSESTVIRWLHENHYSWMMKSWMGSMNRAQMVRRVRDFIFKLARVIRLVNAGKAVIVGTDEAYVQQSLCTTKTWCPGPASGVNAGNASTGTGPECGARTNIIHAITEKGMLPGSGLLFEGTSKSQQSADYHTAYMGNDTWLKWLKDQLIPSFERAYPGKQMVLLLDNVNYHCVRGEDWITPSAANKKKCADFLRSKGINSISVTRKGENIVVSAEDYERPLKVTRDAVERDGKVVLVKRKPGAPIKDLRAAVTAYLKDHPQETEVQRIMREHNHILLHTPPFSPQAQPIEHLWKIVKGAVRKLYTLHRTQKQTQQQLEQALDNITPQQATGCFHRCMNWINIWIQQDEELSEYGQSIEELAQSAFIDDWRPYEGEDISTLIEDQQQAEQIEHENEDKIETESDENTPPDP